MSNNQAQANPIAADDKFEIVCPYCFNRASGGDGTPISHKKVEFRSGTFFSSIREVEQKLGIKELDIELIDDQVERARKTLEFEKYKSFCLGRDQKYQNFWDSFEGKTTEQASKSAAVQNPWELPIIGEGHGVDHLVADIDGFVTQAVDVFGKTTHNRVCPYCHNPFPLGYGKNHVKYISIIGVVGSGKTVYISQLLKGMTDYASKVGMSAFFTSDHETNFIQNNQVKQGEPLPDSTSPKRLSQPMFYDIVRESNGKQITDTIVLYDIAGENCRNANDMVSFSQFVKYSDGMILLVDPKQLGFLSVELDEDEIDAPSRALNTLHSVLETRQGEKIGIPVAVCISKSDMCSEILPPISQESVQSTQIDAHTGLPMREFDGRTFNELTRGNNGLTDLMLRNAGAVCQELTGYLNYNFFAISAIGCPCDKSNNSPLNRPDPKRIEEPILWLFKQFGFIKSNDRILRPFHVKHADRYIYKKPLFGKPHLEKQPDEFAEYEEDKIRTVPEVKLKGEWHKMINEYAEYAQLPIE